MSPHSLLQVTPQGLCVSVILARTLLVLYQVPLTSHGGPVRSAAPSPRDPVAGRLTGQTRVLPERGYPVDCLSARSVLLFAALLYCPLCASLSVRPASPSWAI